MSGAWEAVNARARGLAAHLLSPDRLSRLARCGDVPEVARELSNSPYGAFIGPGDRGPAELEGAVTRSVGERLAVLARWTHPDGVQLAPVFLEFDAQAVRDIVRGTVGALAPDQRLAGAIPTPTLGRRALEALARSDTPARAAAALVAWGHPLGSPLLDEASRAHPDLFRLEGAISRATGRACSRAARRGGSAMRRFVQDGIDARNVVVALLLVQARAEADPAALWAEGGRTLRHGAFARAARAGDWTEGAAVLGEALRGTPFGEVLRTGPFTPVSVASRLDEARIEQATRSARAEPLTALPSIVFVLRLRKEARLVRRALWTAALAGGGGGR